MQSIWLPKLLADILVGQIAPTVIYTNSHNAFAIAQNHVFHARTNHIEVHYHYVKERWSEGDIKLSYVPTEDNSADLFTKALPQPKFEAFRHTLNLVPFVT